MSWEFFKSLDEAKEAARPYVWNDLERWDGPGWYWEEVIHIEGRYETYTILRTYQRLINLRHEIYKINLKIKVAEEKDRLNEQLVEESTQSVDTKIQNAPTTNSRA